MKKDILNIKFRIPRELHLKIIADLKRPHPFAYERVGFLYAKTKWLNESTAVIIVVDYNPVADDDYIKDKSVGARINSTAIRKAMQGTIDRNSGCFHVHLHDHNGKPAPSFTDKESLPGVVHSLSNVASQQANGYLILSKNGFFAEIKVKGRHNFYSPKAFCVVGYPMLFQMEDQQKKKHYAFDRQSFLGERSQFLFDTVKIGIVGYGGGGSHVGQQLAHIGVINVIVFDDDQVEFTNLNRLIGAWFRDIKKALFKIKIAERTIKKILPNAQVKLSNVKWQLNPELLQDCDIVFGCVDSYTERQQLEAECRRYLIPYIDIGMDVHESEGYSMSGQTILSMPGTPCMNCYGFLSEIKLSKEAKKYGKIGGRPQVVWSNGILASTAVSVFVDIVTGWTQVEDKLIYLEYNGNKGTLNEHVRLRFAPNKCEHYLLKDAGPADFKKL